jgi:hypothetical protein
MGLLEDAVYPSCRRDIQDGSCFPRGAGVPGIVLPAQGAAHMSVVVQSPLLIHLVRREELLLASH